MPKGRNYSEKDFKKIENGIPFIGINNINKLEAFANKMNRDPWSLYCFIRRKLSINVLPDIDIRNILKSRYNKSNLIRKEYKAKKRITQIDTTPGTLKRPPAIYSNLDVIKWADSLLD